MNAQLKPIGPTSDLDEAIARRETARAKVEQIAQAAARAEQVSSADAAEVADLKVALSVAQGKKAQNLAGIFLAGMTKLTIAASSEEQQLESRLATATSRASVSGDALVLVRAAHAQAQVELTAAEVAVEDCAIRIYVAQAEDYAQKATKYRAFAEGCLEQVRYATSIARQFNRGAKARLSGALEGSAVIRTAGAPPAPPAKPASDWGLSPHETSAARRLAAAIQPWEELFASLLRGDFTKADAA